MGCDIHPYVEVRENGQWRMYRVKVQCHHCKGTGIDSDKESDDDNDKKQCWWCDGKGTTSDIYSGRNYWLFNLLAGVRGGPFPPIGKEKGVPKNASKRYKILAKGPDWHSHSYFSLAQLEKAVDWANGFVEVEGYINSWNYALAKIGELPTWQSEEEIEYFREANPKRLAEMLITEDELVKGISDGTLPTSFEGYCKDYKNGSKIAKMKWKIYYQSLSRYWTDITLPTLRKLGEKFGPTNVRLVFFFDN